MYDGLTCNLWKLFNNLLFCFALGDGSNKQSVIGHRDAHADVFTRSNFTVVALQKYKIRLGSQILVLSNKRLLDIMVYR